MADNHMSLTHAQDITEYAARIADRQDLRDQAAAAIAQLNAINNDATVTTAEAVNYLKQVAVIERALVKLALRML